MLGAAPNTPTPGGSAPGNSNAGLAGVSAASAIARPSASAARSQDGNQMSPPAGPGTSGHGPGAVQGRPCPKPVSGQALSPSVQACPGISKCSSTQGSVMY